MMREASLLLLLGFASAALILAFSAAGLILLLLRSVPEIDGFLLMWRGISFGDPSLPFFLTAFALRQAGQPKGIYSYREALNFYRAGTALLLGFGLLFLKMVIDVGIYYIALGLILAYITARLKSK
jgi:hypothetical protein